MSKNVRMFKEHFIEVWTSLLTLISKVSLLVSFLLIPFLLGSIAYTLFKGLCVQPLVYSVILLVMIHTNKQL